MVRPSLPTPPELTGRSKETCSCAAYVPAHATIWHGHTHTRATTRRATRKRLARAKLCPLSVTVSKICTEPACRRPNTVYQFFLIAIQCSNYYQLYLECPVNHGGPPRTYTLSHGGGMASNESAGSMIWRRPRRVFQGREQTGKREAVGDRLTVASAAIDPLFSAYYSSFIKRTRLPKISF